MLVLRFLRDIIFINATWLVAEPQRYLMVMVLVRSSLITCLVVILVLWMRLEVCITGMVTVFAMHYKMAGRTVLPQMTVGNTGLNKEDSEFVVKLRCRGTVLLMTVT